MTENRDIDFSFMELVIAVKTIITNARKNAATAVNSELLLAYWHIGKEILDREKLMNQSDQSTRQLILDLSKKLTAEIGRGFSRSNLFNMRKFYLAYPNVQTVSGQLSWSHFSELLVIESHDKRQFYEIEAVNSKWSVRELKRQIESSMFERLLLANKSPNLAKKQNLLAFGQEINQADDLIKSPYVFEFLGLPEKALIKETELEARLLKHLESFLLELGKGFMFVGSQQRVTLNNTHHYVDMVFYNKTLRCYILVELKTRKLKITDAGQLNTYLNYFKTEVNDLDDNPPIGIILCAEKDEIAAEYILGGLDNQVFASKFTYVLPDVEELMDEVKRIVDNEK